jgi:hypothetical protein
MASVVAAYKGRASLSWRGQADTLALVGQMTARQGLWAKRRRTFLDQAADAARVVVCRGGKALDQSASFRPELEADDAFLGKPPQRVTGLVAELELELNCE